MESVQEWFFNWYPVFGVFFMVMLLLVFMRMLRMTVGSTKPETIKASKGRPVTWDEVQGVDAAKDELLDVAEWLREPDRFKSLGAAPLRGQFSLRRIAVCCDGDLGGGKISVRQIWCREKRQAPSMDTVPKRAQAKSSKRNPNHHIW